MFKVFKHFVVTQQVILLEFCAYGVIFAKWYNYTSAQRNARKTQINVFSV